MKYSKLQSLSLILFFFSVNFEIWDPFNTGGFFSLAKLFGIIYFLTILPTINKFIVIPKKIRGIVTPLILFYILLLLMNSLNIGYASSDFLSTSILLNIIFFIFVINHERLMPGIIEKAFIGFLFGAVLSVICFYLGIGVEVTLDGRVSLFGDNQNIIGLRMVIALFFLTHLLTKYGKNLSKTFSLSLILLYFPLNTLLLNTGSRVAVISLMVGVVLFIALYKFKNILIKALILLAFILLSGAGLNFILSSEVVGKRLMQTVEQGNLAGRDDIWRSILPLIQDNLLFGIGQTGYADLTIKAFGRLTSPHNVILEVLSYTGFIGLFLYLLFIYRAFFSSLKYYIKYGDVIPLLFAIPVAGVLLSGQMLMFKLGWFVLAYAATRKYYT